MRQLLLVSLYLVSYQSSPREDCQIHTYFSYEEKKLVHLLNLDPFSKESRETEIASIVVTPTISFSSESLVFFAMVYQVTLSIFFLLVNV